MVAATKRTRAKSTNEETFNTSVPNDIAQVADDVTEEPSTKKRGRKPRGSKIIDSNNDGSVENAVLPNVIVHFRCKSSELEQIFNSEIIGDSEPHTSSHFREKDCSKYAEIQSLTNQVHTNASSANNKRRDIETKQYVALSDGCMSKGPELGFAYVDEWDKEDILLDVEDENIKMWLPSGDPREHVKKTIVETTGGKNNVSHFVNISQPENHNIDTVEINEKIHEMEVNFHNNNTNGKRSSCFWDTCPFDTPPFYIPKAIDAHEVRPYGCFCSLNCALAYLQSEDIDSSAKFERRQLMFNLYSKVVGDKTFVKPAPNPRYTLDKYYGNLSIQQWRSLLAGDRMLLIVDKPLTPELPQLHTETTDRFLSMGNTTTNDVAQYGKFKIRKVAPKQSKGDIVAEKFGAFTSSTK